MHALCCQYVQGYNEFLSTIFLPAAGRFLVGEFDTKQFTEHVSEWRARFGTGNKEKWMGWDKEADRVVALHNHKFDIYEEALFVGVDCYLEWIRRANKLLKVLNV